MINRREDIHTEHSQLTYAWGHGEVWHFTSVCNSNASNHNWFTYWDHGERGAMF